MYNLMIGIGRIFIEYVKGLVGRARISSITEWPMHRDW